LGNTEKELELDFNLSII